MLIIIPTVERSVKMQGDCEKNFTCEVCGGGYAYTQTRTVLVREHFFTLSLTSRSAFEKLKRTAERKLLRALDREFDMVPCPDCGWVQKQMSDYRNAWAYYELRILSLFLHLTGIVPGGIFIALAVNDWPSQNFLAFGICWLVFFVGCGLGISYLRKRVLRSTDPNRGFDRNRK